MAPVWDPSTGRHLTYSSTLEGERGGYQRQEDQSTEERGDIIMHKTGCWWKRIACHSSLLVEGRGHSQAFDV